MIGKRLYQLRKTASMTQQQLADMLQVSKYAISSYENTNTSPKDELKLQLAKIFNVSLDYLLGLIDTPLPYNRDDENVLCLPASLSEQSKKEIEKYIEFIVSKEEDKKYR